MFFFFQAEDGILDFNVTGVQTCALPISHVAPAACVRLQGWCKLAPQKYYKTRAGKRPRSMEETKMQEIEAFHRRSLQEREAFWAEQARRVHWQAPWQQVLDDSRLPFAKWFVGGRTNLCFNAVDRWAQADPDAPALIWVSTEVGQERILTRAQLLAEVNAAAAMLQEMGVGRGDRVLLYMPMIPEAACVMLACARIGAVHSVVFGGFASANLAQRIDDAAPRVVVSADAGSRAGKVMPYKPLPDKALAMGARPPHRGVIFA